MNKKYIQAIEILHKWMTSYLQCDEYNILYSDNPTPLNDTEINQININHNYKKKLWLAPDVSSGPPYKFFVYKDRRLTHFICKNKYYNSTSIGLISFDIAIGDYFNLKYVFEVSDLNISNERLDKLEYVKNYFPNLEVFVIDADWIIDIHKKNIIPKILYAKRVL